MPYFLWTSDLATGNRDLDTDHRRLAEAFDAVLVAFEAGLAPISIGEKMQNLSDLAKAHFDRENSILNNADGYGVLAHLDDHQLLLNEIETMKRQIEAGTSLNPATIYDYFRTWLRTHITSFDLKMTNRLSFTSTEKLP